MTELSVQNGTVQPKSPIKTVEVVAEPVFGIYTTVLRLVCFEKCIFLIFLYALLG